MKWFRLSTLLIIGMAVMTVSGLVFVPVTTASAAPTYVDVSATQGWQQTPVTLHRGDKVSLWYERGSWSVDHVNFPYVGPDGYSSAVDQKIYQGCKLNPHWVYGLMLGRVGNGPTMVVGESATLAADRDGPLELRIHDGDACLGDNAGAIRMEYSVQAAPPTFSPAVAFSPSSGAVGTSFTITGSGWMPGGTVTATLPHGSPGWFTGYQTPTVDANGHFSYKETVGTGPHGPTPPGKYTITYAENYHGTSLSASQTFTVTPPPHPDFPWSGWSEYPASGSVRSVTASWVVPTLNCNIGTYVTLNNPSAAVWVGMWGSGSEPTTSTTSPTKGGWLPQIGTLSYCPSAADFLKFRQQDQAVWEIYTNTQGQNNQHFTTIKNFTVRPGDKIAASVTFDKFDKVGRALFWMKITDRRGRYVQTWDNGGKPLLTRAPVTLDQVAAQGGVILEDNNNTGALAEFNPPSHQLKITGLTVTGDSRYWTYRPWEMWHSNHHLVTHSKVSGWGNFTFTWLRSS